MALPSRATLVTPLAAAALALGAQPSLASFAGRNGPIALTQFETSRENADFSSIELISSQGKGLGRLSACTTRSVACPSAPSFSPDGARVAYDSGAFAPAGTRLVVAAVDGAAKVTLPALTESDTDPAFSPDGTRLVFVGRTANGASIDLYVVGLDGGGLRRLTSRGGLAPAWASSDRIAYVRGSQIRVVNADGSGDRRVATGDRPDWSPSGKTIAYDLKGTVYTLAVRAQGAKKARRRLLRRGAELAVWSPDARRLALLRPSGDVPSDLYVVRRDGTGPKRIYRTRSADDTAFNSVLEAAWGRRR